MNARQDYERPYRPIVRVMLTAVAIFVVLAAVWKLLDLLVLAIGGALVNLLLVLFGAVFLAGNPHGHPYSRQEVRGSKESKGR